MAVFSWFGYRNIAYIGFLVLAIVLANVPSDTDPAGRGLQIAFVYGLLLLISLPFFGVNAVLGVIALVKKSSANKAFHRLFAGGYAHTLGDKRLALFRDLRHNTGQSHFAKPRLCQIALAFEPPGRDQRP
jgi:hypothetical protein